MTGVALTFILISAVAHAAWNVTAKRGAGVSQVVFMFRALVSASVLMLPVGVVLLILDPVTGPGWWFAIGTGILHAFYFLLLGYGYRHADLSIVYPIARGLGPALVPVLGVLVLDEIVPLLAVAGIVAVVIGIYTVYWWGTASAILRDPWRLVREPGTRFAILTGVTIAVYSVWDKVGVRHVNPFAYMYLGVVGSVALMLPFMVRVNGAGEIFGEWRRTAVTASAAGVLIFLAYGLILAAFRITPVSYVAPAREIGIVVGVLLGAVVLKESLGPGRLAGSCLIVLGLVLIALAPS